MLEKQNISKTLLYETGTTGFYFSYRENEMRPVSVKHFGNFCTSIEPKQSNRTPRDDSTVRNWLFFTVFYAPRVERPQRWAFLTFKKQRKVTCRSVSQSRQGQGESLLPEAPCSASAIRVNIPQTDPCLKGCY